MSTIEKLKRRFFEKPIRNDITQKEIERLAKHYGCDIYTGGNHQKRIVHVGTGTVIPLPQHSKTVAEPYVKELQELFESIGEEG